MFIIVNLLCGTRVQTGAGCVNEIGVVIREEDSSLTYMKVLRACFCDVLLCSFLLSDYLL